MKKEQERLIISAILRSDGEVREILRHVLILDQVEEKMNFDLWKFTERKDELRPALRGIHYQNGFAEATDANIAVRVKQEYKPELEGKIVLKDGSFCDGQYPDFDKVLPEETAEISIDETTVRRAMTEYKARKKEKDEYHVKCKTKSGHYYSPHLLIPFLSACKKLNLKMYYGTYGQLFGKNGNGEFSICMNCRIAERDENEYTIYEV